MASISENPYQPIIQQLEHNLADMEQLSFICPHCGAQVIQIPGTDTQKCPFCGTPLTGEPVMGRAIPAGIVPAKFGKDDAVRAFHKWIKSRFLAPGSMKQEAQISEFRAVYLPFWSFSCDVTVDYTGQATEGEGENAAKTPVSGQVTLHLENELVYAGKKLKPVNIPQFLQRQLPASAGYSLESLGEFSQEVSGIKADAAFEEAKQSTDSEIEQEIQQKAGKAEIETLVRNYTNVKITQVLLPAWMSFFRYRDKVYQIAVDAQNGKASGEYPREIRKVLLLIVIILAILAGGIFAIRLFLMR